MTRRRWIANEFTDTTAALTGENAAHLARALRAKVGQEFDIAVGERVRRGTVTSVSEDRVEFELGDEVPASAALPIELLLAVFKFDRMEWAIEKATELGVERIIPVLAQRTEKHLAQASAKRLERWRRIAHEAAQQSRRVAPPEIFEPLKFKDVLSPGGIVLAECEAEGTLRHFLATATLPVRLAVGPEGGWTDGELEQFKQCGWHAATLGSTVLRAETAAIAALAIVAGELGQP
jgi:16S rRNA (uracil1498-N3)-methyltransferase